MRAIHPDITALMALTVGTPALGTLPPDEMRRSYTASRKQLQPEFDPVTSIEDRTIPGPAGPLPLRIYRGGPADAVLPCLLFLHGGGWVLGNLDSHEGICRRLAAAARCCVIAVDYRLAPEHPFPPRWTTAPPPCAGSPPKPPPYASTRPAWPSAATAPAATSPPC